MSTNICNNNKSNPIFSIKKNSLFRARAYIIVCICGFAVVVNMLLSTENEWYERIELFPLFVLSISFFLSFFDFARGVYFRQLVKFHLL
jgi:hypothetical protein